MTEACRQRHNSEPQASDYFIETIMSKNQLKKELTTLSHDQLVALVLDAYSARRETRDYFEFFLNPDADSLKERYRVEIEREMTRGKYGSSTMRITRIKRALKDFESFSPGVEYVLSLRLYAIETMLKVERLKRFRDTQYRGCAALINETVIWASKNEIFDSCIQSVKGFLSPSGPASSRMFRFLEQNIKL